MSEVTLEADIRGDDKCDAYDPKPTLVASIFISSATARTSLPFQRTGKRKNWEPSSDLCCFARASTASTFSQTLRIDVKGQAIRFFSVAFVAACRVLPMKPLVPCTHAFNVTHQFSLLHEIPKNLHGLVVVDVFCYDDRSFRPFV